MKPARAGQIFHIFSGMHREKSYTYTRIFHALSNFGFELLGGGGATIVMPQISVKICIRNRISARCVCRQFGKSVAKFG